ncbi:MAG: PAS domain-containing protein [Gemmatimonadota bacterium]
MSTGMNANGTTTARYMRCVMTPEGVPESCDRAWDAFTGIDAGRLRADSWGIVVHEDDRSAFDDARREGVHSFAPFEVDLRIRRSDGEYRWCQVTGEPVRAGARGRTAVDAPRWFVRFVDIHRHKLVQSELEQALRRRDDSLATFAHDLRNPVQTMRHALFALRLDGVSSDARPKMLAVLERQIDVMARQTEEYLHDWQERSVREERAPAELSSETKEVT